MMLKANIRKQYKQIYNYHRIYIYFLAINAFKFVVVQEKANEIKISIKFNYCLKAKSSKNCTSFVFAIQIKMKSINKIITILIF